MSEEAQQPGQRKRVLIIIALVFCLAGLGYFGWWLLHGRHHETTDDAYVAGNLIRVTPRVAGTVVAVLADDTDYVKQGQMLVKLDDTDARLALAKAEAALGATVRQVAQAFDLVAERQAGLSLKEETLRQAQDDLARRQGMAELRAVSKEETDHARATVAKAQADLQLTQAQLASARSAVHGTPIESHPAVAQAAAQVREAYVTLSRCQIRAAESGHIAKRSVQVGQQVASGAALMALVPLDQLWVEANFKEDQLQRMRLSQPVELRSDLYGGDVTYHGKIVGVDPGTGATFSLLPPQNASGNWIKIVQRLPVRIALDPKEITDHPLLVGLSMKATADTRDLDGPALATGSAGNHYETPVFDDADQGAAAQVRQIIAANRGPRK
jgi:membrane fusion protein (multidrug efflux system)